VFKSLLQDDGLSVCSLVTRVNVHLMDLIRPNNGASWILSESTIGSAPIRAEDACRGDIELLVKNVCSLAVFRDFQHHMTMCAVYTSMVNRFTILKLLKSQSSGITIARPLSAGK